MTATKNDVACPVSILYMMANSVFFTVLTFTLFINKKVKINQFN